MRFNTLVERDTEWGKYRVNAKPGTDRQVLMEQYLIEARKSLGTAYHLGWDGYVRSYIAQALLATENATDYVEWEPKGDLANPHELYEGMPNEPTNYMEYLGNE